jgi:para-nitrobenzyl esterase
LIAAGGALLAWRSLEGSAAAMSTDRPSVQPAAGPIVGRLHGEVRVFKGIPFARPPVGALRFRPPQPHPKWDQPFDAGAFGPGPIQPAMEMIQIPNGVSEDCLTLNIWAPPDKGPHPVLFSIYGGGNYLGASSQAAYDGAAFARRGLVYVSANYRLGAFGFLELGGIDPAYAGSGLNGLLDIQAALEWVRDNIEAFGGDPGAVTLIGISAGGKNQCALAAMPSARGLFKRATIMSGGGHTVFRSQEEATPVARALLAAAGLEKQDVRALAALPAEALLTAQGKVVASYPKGFPYRPTVDGDRLPQAPVDAARAGATAHLDIVVGTARDEAALYMPPPLAEQPFRPGQVANVSLATVAAAEAAYAGTFPDVSLADRRIRQLTAEEYWIPSVRFAEAHARNGGRVHMYRFDWSPSDGPFAGYACHGADSPFVYGTPRPGMPVTDDEAAAMRRTHALWANWARTGALRLEGGPEWPAYDEARRATFIFDRTPRIEADPRGAERRIWERAM